MQDALQIDKMLPKGRLMYLMGRVDMNNAGGKYDSNCDDEITRTEDELVALRHVARRQKMTLLACKQFLEQLQEKGISLSFTERTAVGLLLESIKRFE